jgi:CRISPR-associated RAMP protein (TIGR02581 family)
MFERFDSRIDLNGRLTLLTGLHIGTGGSHAVTGSDNPVVRDGRGLPYVPGSSFKGALRSTVEALLRAISSTPGREPWACDPLDEEGRCVTAADVREKDDQEVSDLVQRSVAEGGKACTVCRLFGSPWLASKVKVKDLYVSNGEGWPGRTEVRDGVAIDRDTETVAGGRKYDFEVIPSGVSFDLHIVIDNADTRELGLLFLGLREFEAGRVPLGGKVSRGLGGVRIEWTRYERVMGPDGLRSFLRTGHGDVLEGRPREHFRQQCLEAFLSTSGTGGTNVQ